MALGTAAAIGTGFLGLGTLGGAAASAEAGRAAGAAAQASAAEARRQSERAESFGRELMQFTPQELQAYERSLEVASNLVKRDSALLEAIDPALMEASTQALKLLRGEEASALAPIKNQRAAQRSELVRTLREQLGPGAETSSAGQRALQRFDMETSSLLGSTQQSTLQSFLNVAGGTRQQIPGNIATLTGVGQAAGQRSLQAGMGTLNAITGAGQNLINTAGSPFVAAQTQAQGMGSLFNQFGRIGGSLLGGSLFGKESKAPTGSQWEAFTSQWNAT